MTPQALKNSILQRAIQGKLVEQRKEEGTAVDLLKEIHAEKERLIKEKKIKKSKPLPEITDDEKPFDIPDNWKWVRLGDIVSKEVKRGKSPTYTNKSTVLVFAQKCNTKQGNIDLTLAKYLDEEKIKKYPESEFMQDKDIIINSTGLGTMGRVGLYRNMFNHHHLLIVPDSHVTIIRIFSNILPEYAFYVLKTYQKYFEQNGDGSTKQKELRPYVISTTLVPLPPLSEQRRIVSKLEEIFPYINQYANAYDKLSDLNQCFPEDMKKSLLQYAMQGKLVEQHPEEGTDADLLKEIHAEKERLIKEKKIKKSKPLPEITEAEKPFDIPDNWSWCRLGDLVADLIAGKSPKCDNQPVIDSQWGVIKTTAIQENYFDDTSNKILPTNFEISPDWIIEKNNILITRAGPINRTGVACVVDRCRYNLMLSDKTINIKLVASAINHKFIVFAINSPVIRKIILSYSSGMDKQQVNISQNKIRLFPLPIPPISEQYRIVDRLEKLLSICKKIINN